MVFKQDELLGGNGRLMWVLLVPIAAFWYLDAFFLSTEKRYREMYKWVIANRSLTDKYLYDLNTMERVNPDGATTNFVQPQNSVWKVVFSKTFWPFYLVPVLFVAIYMGVKMFTC